MYSPQQMITDTLIEVLRDKDADYGSSSHNTFMRFGKISYIQRMMDKAARWENLSMGACKEPRVNEKRIDTLFDLLGYLALFAADMTPSADKPRLDIAADFLREVADVYSPATAKYFEEHTLHDKDGFRLFLTNVICDLFLGDIAPDTWYNLGNYVLWLILEEKYPEMEGE